MKLAVVVQRYGQAINGGAELHARYIAEQTVRRGWQGRVALGHMSEMAALPPDDQDALARQLAAAGVAVIVLPATDLYLMGRKDVRSPRRGLAPIKRLLAAGVTVAAATNNVRNAFTPLGNAGLPLMGYLVAIAAHMGAEPELALNSLSGRISTKDDNLWLENVSIRTAESSLRVDGSVNQYLKERSFDLKVTSDKLSLPETARVVPAVGNRPLTPAFEITARGPAQQLALDVNVRSQAGDVVGSVTADVQAPAGRDVPHLQGLALADQQDFTVRGVGRLDGPVLTDRPSRQPAGLPDLPAVGVPNGDETPARDADEGLAVRGKVDGVAQ